MNWSEYSVNLHSNHSCIFTDIIFWSGRGWFLEEMYFHNQITGLWMTDLLELLRAWDQQYEQNYTFKSWMLEIAVELLSPASVVRNQDVSENSMTDLCKACLFWVYRPWFKFVHILPAKSVEQFHFSKPMEFMKNVKP